MNLGGFLHLAILVLVFHIFDGLSRKHDNWPVSFTVNSLIGAIFPMTSAQDRHF
jgi:hypothetical protein